MYREPGEGAGVEQKAVRPKSAALAEPEQDGWDILAQRRVVTALEDGASCRSAAFPMSTCRSVVVLSCPPESAKTSESGHLQPDAVCSRQQYSE